MKTISERAQAVINAIEAREAEHQHLAELLADRINEMADQAQEISDLRANIDTWRSLAQMTHWLEVNIGEQIDVGMKVRFFAKTYESITNHKKSLAETPLDISKWKEI